METKQSETPSELPSLITPDTDLESLLESLEKYRVLFYELEMDSGSRLVVNAQLNWQDDKGENRKL